MRYRRHIPLAHAHNLRDLGGFPTADGRTTRWGLLYRSDELSELTQEEWETVRGLGVRTLIDLRSRRETESAKITPAYPLEYRNLSLMKELDERPPARPSDGSASGSILESMRLDYTKTLFGNLGCAAEILRVILGRLSRGGSVLFFCSAGKDRTGITAAMVLSLCGVLREDIIADYMVSNTYNTEGINQNMEVLPPEFLARIPNLQILKDMMDSKPENMSALLDAFEEHDLRARLAENGFDRGQQEQLAARMLE